MGVIQIAILLKILALWMNFVFFNQTGRYS